MFTVLPLGWPAISFYFIFNFFFINRYTPKLTVISENYTMKQPNALSLRWQSYSNYRHDVLVCISNWFGIILVSINVGYGGNLNFEKSIM